MFVTRGLIGKRIFFFLFDIFFISFFYRKKERTFFLKLIGEFSFQETFFFFFFFTCETEKNIKEKVFLKRPWIIFLIIFPSIFSWKKKKKNNFQEKMLE